jgi:hypothetical protein
MIKVWSVALGIGLAILWIAGFGTMGTASWLTWLDGLAALCAFVIAGSVSDASPVGARAGSTGALAVGLFVLWIIAQSSAVVAWQSWWTFAFACAFGLLAIATGFSSRSTFGQFRGTPSRDRDQFQRSA